MVRHTVLDDNDKRKLLIRSYATATFDELIIQQNGYEVGIDVTPGEAENLKELFGVDEE
jgi:hypothetical protein